MAETTGGRYLKGLRNRRYLVWIDGVPATLGEFSCHLRLGLPLARA